MTRGYFNRKTFILINGVKIFGVDIDDNSRCIHYHSDRDIVAIKFKCCRKYYSCYKCHNEMEDHNIIIWNVKDFGSKVVMCGLCGFEMSVWEYMNSNFRCPNCCACFNDGCKKHFHFYFDVS
ncbi:MAG: CHY zinc finger protein [Brevinematales bacterium]|nr:CHY zinc finger protein [Brevinematales bacterium]